LKCVTTPTLDTNEAAADACSEGSEITGSGLNPLGGFEGGFGDGFDGGLAGGSAGGVGDGLEDGGSDAVAVLINWPEQPTMTLRLAQTAISVSRDP
jgi:hypothetical protein